MSKKADKESVIVKSTREDGEVTQEQIDVATMELGLTPETIEVEAREGGGVVVRAKG
jgi:hypothetical protein